VRRLGTRHYPLPDEMQTSFMRLIALPKLSKYPPVIVPPNEVRVRYHYLVFSIGYLTLLRRCIDL